MKLLHSQWSEPMSTSMKKTLLTIAKSLYALVVIGAVAFALLFVGTRVDLLGYEVKVVKSGSMEPAVNVGGIVIVAPHATYGVGDIITFGSDTKNRIPVTHRIVEVVPTGMTTAYRTKGDANEEADGQLVRAREVIGKVVFDLPYVGYAIDFARTPLGFLLLVGIPALVIVIDEIANIIWEIHKYRFRKRAGKVGYRTPSRERNRQQFVPKVSATGALKNEHLKETQKQPTPKAFDVGLPAYTYTRNRQSI